MSMDGLLLRGLLRRMSALHECLLGVLLVSVGWCGSVAAQHDWNSSPWAKIWASGNAYYMLNNQYTPPSSLWQGIWLTSDTSWGGDWNFGSGSGGTFPSLVYGQWPWDSANTHCSGLPIQISQAGNWYLQWSFTPAISSGSWNAPIEVWTHSSSAVSADNITCDIMIEPNYTDFHGTYKEAVTLSGVSYKVYYQWQSASPGYEIIHFQRSTKANSTGRINLKDFLNYCVTKGYTSNSDWIGSINTGVEPFSGTGGFDTTAYYVQREKYEHETLGWRHSGAAWNVHDASISGASNGKCHDSGTNGASDWVEFDVRVFQSATYAIHTRVQNGPNRGTFQLKINGTNQASTFDTYSSGYSMSGEISHGTKQLNKGLYKFRYQVTGKNASSSNYEGNFDYIRLVKQ